MKIKFLILLSLCIVVISSSAVPIAELNNPIIIVNKESPDAPYAKLIMDKFCTYKNIKIQDRGVEVNENIYYNIPANNSFEIKDGDGDILYISFNIDTDGSTDTIKYNRIEYRKDYNDNKILFLNNIYTILKSENGNIILANEVKNISTNNSFKYNDYKIVLKAISFDNNDIILDILKDNKPIKKDINVKKGDIKYIKDLNMAIYYKNLSKHGKTNIFSFKIYHILELEDGKDFTLNPNFKVNLNKNEIILKYKYPEHVKKIFNILNYTVKPEKIAHGLTYFSVYHKIHYIINKGDLGIKYLGDNIFAVKKGDRLYLYKDGNECNDITEYYKPDTAILDSDVLNTDSDLILIGGPISNNITKRIENHLKIPITNENPGKNRGVIQVIKNPYNPNYKIMVIAGSDRNGTKACVLALLKGLYKNEEIMTVELEKDGSVKVIK